MTLIAFNPANSTPPFVETFILDGESHTAIATWNIYAQRWYLTLKSSSDELVWSGSIIESPDTYDIELAPGIFKTSTIIFRSGSGTFEISP